MAEDSPGIDRIDEHFSEQQMAAKSGGWRATIGWLEGLAAHGGLTHEPNTLLNTRTLTTNRLLRWVNWNMTYHTVHPTFPSVPFYRLPTLHREVEAQLGHALPSSPYFKLHWRHLRAMFGGATELDLCEAHTRQVVNAGQLRSAAAE